MLKFNSFLVITLFTHKPPFPQVFQFRFRRNAAVSGKRRGQRERQRAELRFQQRILNFNFFDPRIPGGRSISRSSEKLFFAQCPGLPWHYKPVRIASFSVQQRPPRQSRASIFTVYYSCVLPILSGTAAARCTLTFFFAPHQFFNNRTRIYRRYDRFGWSLRGNRVRRVASVTRNRIFPELGTSLQFRVAAYRSQRASFGSCWPNRRLVRLYFSFFLCRPRSFFASSRCKNEIAKGIRSEASVAIAQCSADRTREKEKELAGLHGGSVWEVLIMRLHGRRAMEVWIVPVALWPAAKLRPLFAQSH